MRAHKQKHATGRKYAGVTNNIHFSVILPFDDIQDILAIVQGGREGGRSQLSDCAVLLLFPSETFTANYRYYVTSCQSQATYHTPYAVRSIIMEELDWPSNEPVGRITLENTSSLTRAQLFPDQVINILSYDTKCILS